MSSFISLLLIKIACTTPNTAKNILSKQRPHRSGTRRFTWQHGHGSPTSSLSWSSRVICWNGTSNGGLRWNGFEGACFIKIGPQAVLSVAHDVKPFLPHVQSTWHPSRPFYPRTILYLIHFVVLGTLPPPLHAATPPPLRAPAALRLDG
jgi:hypothetical protein